MRVLFIHQNFPGQFRHLAPALAAAGHEVRALAITPRAKFPGVTVHRYQPKRASTQGVHPLAAEFETKVIRGEACAGAMLQLRKSGFTPDLIVAHPGWGESLFAKDVYPEARLLAFVEYHYGARDGDVGFDPEFRTDAFVERARMRVKNANGLIALDAMDWGLSPTRWQRSTAPVKYHERISVVFDGIDTNKARPDPDAQLMLKFEQSGETRAIRPGDEVLTFVNRNLEPYRGYHVFMRALPEIQRRRPNAITLIVGADDTSYGAKPPPGTTWKQRFLDEVAGSLDMSRVFFLGHLPYDDYMRVLQVSACHVYLTYPFVLSWSCLEAMSAGALVVASDTAPVREVIGHGRNGLLFEFFDREALVGHVVSALAEPDRYRSVREAARATAVERYDLAKVCLPRQLALVDAVAAGRRPEIPQ